MKLKKILIVFIAGAGLLFIFYFLMRNAFLHFALNKIEDKINVKYNSELKINNSYFSGFSTINLEGIYLLPDGADTLVTVHQIKADISFLKLVSGKLPYNELFMDFVQINLVKRDSITNNYSVFLKEKKQEADSAVTEKTISGYGTVLNNNLNRVFRFLSGEVYVRSLRANYISNDIKRFFMVPELSLKRKEFNCIITDSSFEKPFRWNISGTLNKNSRSIGCIIALDHESKKLIPLISSKSEFKYLLDTCVIDMNSYHFDGSKLTVHLSFAFKNLKLNHWRLAVNDVNFDSLKFTGHIVVDENKIGFDTSSFLSMNQMLLNFSYFYDRSNGKSYLLKADMPETPAQDFFESLPGGMFSTLKGIEVSGHLSYHLDFKINKQNPDSVTFDSELKKHDFKILKYGEEYFPKINGSFSHTAYNDYGPVRTFIVGIESPGFTPYIIISNYLKNSVLTEEDGSFFFHRGFNEEAFRESIATNMKAGRFVRGGSTISMQLVKNVFLSRNKTISRKIEEALIVWLIENNHLVSKERMFEIYLNIIEWGPDVYGIKEASSFYFGKNPWELTLAESIYLASIIPHPKYFKYSFDSLGNLKPFLSGFYKLVADRMLRKEKITPQDYDALQPMVKLNGPALQYILPADTIPVDFLKPDDILLLE